jgi:hypothetical protein
MTTCAAALFAQPAGDAEARARGTVNRLELLLNSIILKAGFKTRLGLKLTLNQQPSGKARTSGPARKAPRFL